MQIGAELGPHQAKHGKRSTSTEGNILPTFEPAKRGSMPCAQAIENSLWGRGGVSCWAFGWASVLLAIHEAAHLWCRAFVWVGIENGALLSKSSTYCLHW